MQFWVSEDFAREEMMKADNAQDEGDEEWEVRGVTGDLDDSYTTTTATPPSLWGSQVTGQHDIILSLEGPGHCSETTNRKYLENRWEPADTEVVELLRIVANKWLFIIVSESQIANDQTRSYSHHHQNNKTISN